jgi:hypothetical protein
MILFKVTNNYIFKLILIILIISLVLLIVEIIYLYKKGFVLKVFVTAKNIILV